MAKHEKVNGELPGHRGGVMGWVIYIPSTDRFVGPFETEDDAHSYVVEHMAERVLFRIAPMHGSL